MRRRTWSRPIARAWRELEAQNASLGQQLERVRRLGGS